MKNKWVRKILSLLVTLVIMTVFSSPTPALAAPVTTISLSGTMGDNNYYVSDVTVTLSATDNISGVSIIEYSFDNWYTVFTYSSPFIIGEEGYYSVYARAWDNEGRRGEQALVYLAIDETPPTTTITLTGGPIGNNGWYIGEVGIWLQASDNVSTTGATPIQYSLNGGGTWLDYDGLLVYISNDGITPVLARVRNNAGILEDPPVSGEVKIDMTAPVVTETLIPSQISSKKIGTMFTISYNGTAVDLASGIYLVNRELIDEYGVYSQNLGTNLTGTVSVERHFDKDDPDGQRTYTFRLTVTDMAGHQTTIDAVTTVTRN